jgi:BirA family biotin operon repressor/biotin-[acetyl-CoA-carboxylase] ligase
LNRASITRPELREQLVRALADGEFHSGEQLARALDVSRTAVWKTLRKFAEVGLELHAVPKRGYRLAQPVELLDAAAISRALSPAARRRVRRAERFLSIPSTNTHLLEHADLPAGSTDFCVAEVQSSGRGRRGRLWSAPFGGAICLSMNWLFPDVPRQLSALSLAAGVGVLRALRATGARDIALKWPNDVMFEGRKLGGILIELSAEFSGPAYVVIGIGINYRLTSAARRALHARDIEVADAHEAAGAALAGRNALTAAFVTELTEVLVEFQREGLRPFAREWRSADALAATAARVSYGEQIYRGIARGIDEDGALLLETPGQLLRFTSGEVSVRPGH